MEQITVVRAVSSCMKSKYNKIMECMSRGCLISYGLWFHEAFDGSRWQPIAVHLQSTHGSLLSIVWMVDFDSSRTVDVRILQMIFLGLVSNINVMFGPHLGETRLHPIITPRHLLKMILMLDDVNNNKIIYLN